VTLAPGSRLSRVGTTSAGARELQLDGEAYFDVVAKPDRPFIVHAGPSIVRVLGTTFNVRRYAGDTATIVAVSEGRVMVEEDGVTTLLSAGELIIIPAHGQAVVTQDASAVDAATAWRNGWVRLDHVSLRAAAAELGRWYDIDIRVSDDSLAARTIIASFKDQDMNAVLHHIADALGARVERAGRTVTFSTR
jgi:transmembrane sensor